MEEFLLGNIPRVAERARVGAGGCRENSERGEKWNFFLKSGGRARSPVVAPLIGVIYARERGAVVVWNGWPAIRLKTFQK